LPSLLSFNIANGWVYNTGNFNLSLSTKLSVSSMVEMFNRLGTVSASVTAANRTITLGATNLAKLSEAEKAIATAKNYVLA
jgi:hypothetical protein